MHDSRMVTPAEDLADVAQAPVRPFSHEEHRDMPRPAKLRSARWSEEVGKSDLVEIAHDLTDDFLS